MGDKQTKNEDIRLIQEINEIENQIDQLKKEQRQVQKTFDDFQQDIHRGNLELNHLNQELVHSGGTINLMDQDEQAHYFHHKLSSVGDEMSLHYQKQIKHFENKTENLYQKRREHTWD